MNEIEPMDEVEALMILGNRMGDALNFFQEHYPKDAASHKLIGMVITSAWLAVSMQLDEAAGIADNGE